MDHNESVRKVEPLMLKQADHPRDAATELEALVLLMPSEKSRPLAHLQAAAWIVCTTAAFITARNRQIAQHRQWMARSYVVTFTFVSSRVLNLWPRYWSHLGDTFAAVGVIAFTLASLLVVDLGLNWRELTTRRA